MKDGKTQTQIAQLMERHKSTNSRELARNAGFKGYRWLAKAIHPQEKRYPLSLTRSLE